MPENQNGAIGQSPYPAESDYGRNVGAEAKARQVNVAGAPPEVRVIGLDMNDRTLVEYRGYRVVLPSGVHALQIYRASDSDNGCPRFGIVGNEASLEVLGLRHRLIDDGWTPTREPGGAEMFRPPSANAAEARGAIMAAARDAKEHRMQQERSPQQPNKGEKINPHRTATETMVFAALSAADRKTRHSASPYDVMASAIDAALSKMEITEAMIGRARAEQERAAPAAWATDYTFHRMLAAALCQTDDKVDTRTALEQPPAREIDRKLLREKVLGLVGHLIWLDGWVDATDNSEHQAHRRTREGKQLLDDITRLLDINI